MEQNIVLIHAGLAVIFLLYLFVRLVFSLFGLTNKEYQQAIRARFKVSDWTFFFLLLPTGLYPILVLGDIELYHLIKLLLLVGILWTSRFARNLNFALSSFVSIIFLISAGYSSFTDMPVFPKEQGTFAKDHPEMLNLTEQKKGELIFTTLCVQCHGNDGKKGLFGAIDLTESNVSLDQKIKTITNGSPLTVMRAFAGDLSSQEIEAVAKYVDQLSKK
ncbi:MAG: c-type cytochrome [Cyclobacteriaceae bacterium]